MLFRSIIFLWIFLPAVFLGYRLLHARYRNLFLLLVRVYRDSLAAAMEPYLGMLYSGVLLLWNVPSPVCIFRSPVRMW